MNERLIAAAPQPAPAEQQEWPKLTKRARVGNGTFGVGVSSRLVVEAAQRHEEMQQAEAVKTPEQLREDERNRRKLWGMIHGAIEPESVEQPAGGAVPAAVSDETLWRAAHDGFDNYWTEDSKGENSEAWLASAKSVLAVAAPAAVERKPLTDEQIEKGREATFSTNNPFCPCDSKTMRKAVRWAERTHGIGSSKEGGDAA